MRLSNHLHEQYSINFVMLFCSHLKHVLYNNAEDLIELPYLPIIARNEIFPLIRNKNTLYKITGFWNVWHIL